MRISERISLSPHVNHGTWLIRFDDQEFEYERLNDAVEMVIELSLVIAISDASLAKKVEFDAITLKESLEAFRSMIMTWFNAQIPDPHAVKDINKIN